MTRTSYRIESVHKHYPPADGLMYAEVTVPDEDGRGRFVNIDGLGCSRDYDVPSDVAAIRLMLSEHGAKLIGCQLA